jgi:biotin transporter BioY
MQRSTAILGGFLASFIGLAIIALLLDEKVTKEKKSLTVYIKMAVFQALIAYATARALPLLQGKTMSPIVQGGAPDTLPSDVVRGPAPF